MVTLGGGGRAVTAREPAGPVSSGQGRALTVGGAVAVDLTVPRYPQIRDPGHPTFGGDLRQPDVLQVHVARIQVPVAVQRHRDALDTAVDEVGESFGTTGAPVGRHGIDDPQYPGRLIDRQIDLQHGAVGTPGVDSELQLVFGLRGWGRVLVRVRRPGGGLVASDKLRDLTTQCVHAGHRLIRHLRCQQVHEVAFHRITVCVVDRAGRVREHPEMVEGEHPACQGRPDPGHRDQHGPDVAVGQCPTARNPQIRRHRAQMTGDFPAGVRRDRRRDIQVGTVRPHFHPGQPAPLRSVPPRFRVQPLQLLTEFLPSVLRKQRQHTLLNPRLPAGVRHVSGIHCPVPPRSHAIVLHPILPPVCSIRKGWREILFLPDQRAAGHYQNRNHTPRPR
jgi:hypothetical protein